MILPQMSGDKPAQGWGVSWSIHGVPGWAGRIHHYNLEIRASGANAIEIGQFCPTPASAPVEEVRFFDCQFVETEGVRCVRPISANYCGLGFYDCVWRFGKFTSKEHGVYTRNAFWLELVDCVMLHLGGQDVQSVHRTQEQVGSGLRDCYNHPDIHTKGYLLIDRCVFVRPAIHDERAGSGITIAGSGWDWTIRDTVVIDDGLGKNHAVGGGETYGGMAVWSGGSHKTHPRPSGRFNGKGVIDGLAIWMRSPNRAPLSLQNAEGVDVRRVAVFCGPQMRTVDVLKEAGEVVWQGSEYPEGRNRLLEVAEEYGLSLDPEDMQIPGLRLDGKQQGSSKGQYLLN